MNQKKHLGQHWLKDKQTLVSIAQHAKIQKGDTVLEIGPGEGYLTEVLLGKGANVIAVELDDSLSEHLEGRFSSLPFKLNKLSILDFDFSTLPVGYKIVANIPYYITNQLLRILTNISNMPSVAVLLVQKEVAERVSAKPGRMGLTSVVSQLLYEVEQGEVVKANMFDPAPKVDSQVLIFNKRPKPLYEKHISREMVRLAKMCFSQRRKTIENSLSAGLHLPKDEFAKILSKAHLGENVRPQELSLAQWRELADTVVQNT